MTTLQALAPQLLAYATCPSCHTMDATMTNDAVSKGADWLCARCGQSWNATRLATAAAYDMWVAGHNDMVALERVENSTEVAGYVGKRHHVHRELPRFVGGVRQPPAVGRETGAIFAELCLKKDRWLAIAREDARRVSTVLESRTEESYETPRAR